MNKSNYFRVAQMSFRLSVNLALALEVLILTPVQYYCSEEKKKTD